VHAGSLSMQAVYRQSALSHRPSPMERWKAFRFNGTDCRWPAFSVYLPRGYKRRPASGRVPAFNMDMDADGDMVEKALRCGIERLGVLESCKGGRDIYDV
jgi:hypothetical protein